MVNRTQFSKEFKVEAIRLVKEQGVSIVQAAKDLNAHENVLRKWVHVVREIHRMPFRGMGK